MQRSYLEAHAQTGPTTVVKRFSGDYCGIFVSGQRLSITRAAASESCGQSQRGRKRSTSLNFVSALTDRPAVGLPGALNL